MSFNSAERMGQARLRGAAAIHPPPWLKRMPQATSKSSQVKSSHTSAAMVEAHAPGHVHIGARHPSRQRACGDRERRAQISHRRDVGRVEDRVPAHWGLLELAARLAARVDDGRGTRRAPRVVLVRIVHGAWPRVHVHRPELFGQHGCAGRVAVRCAESRLVRMRPAALDRARGDRTVVGRVTRVGDAVRAADGAALRPPEARLPARTET
jgi:hypothetical protein